MRRKEREIKDRAELEAIIQRAQVCRIGLSESDIPYIVPVHFGFIDNCLYFHCAMDGKKIDILEKNPKVCFEMDIDYELVKSEESPCRWSAKYRSIMGSGKASMVENPLQKSEALNVIIGHYGGESHDFSDDELQQVKVFKIIIDNMSGKQSGY